MITPTQKWNQTLMGVTRDVSTDADPRFTYAILSVPRSGSTLLSRGLEATGLFGVPLEYLNQNSIDAWQLLGDHPVVDLDTYLADIRKRRTSSEGWFGMKVHYRHFDHHFGLDAFSQAVEFTRKQYRRILITRNDHTDQAISYYRARMSGLWSSEHEEIIDLETLPSIPFEPSALLSCLEEVRYGELMWQQVLTAVNEPFLHIIYEDLASDYQKTMERVFRYLGYGNIEVPMPQLRPTAVVQTSDEEKMLRDYLAQWHGQKT